MTFRPRDGMEYYITSKKSGMVLDVRGGSTQRGADIIQWPYHGGANQKFLIEPRGEEGCYQIQSKKSSMVLDVRGASVAAGAEIIQWPNHRGDNQIFKIDQADEDSYHIKAKHSDLVLDVRGASTRAGADLIQWPKHGGDNQKFRISPAYLSSREVKQIVERDLNGKFHSSYRIYFADTDYFVTPLAEARKIIRNSGVDRARWTSQRFDCDDFALVLKADFAKAAYANGERRAAFCFGIVWGMLPGPHAINWMINEDLKLRFIEPQNDSIYFPRANDKDIWFMLC